VAENFAPEADGSADPLGEALGRVVPAALRERLRGQPLVITRPVWGHRHGRHAAARTGLGSEFRDHRAYVPGDDPRRVDWRAAARRERLVLRRTESEDELSITLVLDGGAGMDYGEAEQNKLRYARALVGGLAWLAQRQGDPVGLALGRQEIVDASLIRPRSGRERLNALAHRLIEASPAGRCPWVPLIDAVAPRLQRRSLLVLISDLLDPGTGADDGDAVQEQLLSGLAQLRARGHDVVIVQVLHRDELEFPWTDRTMFRFEDLRDLRPPLEGPGRSLRDDYLHRLHLHLDRLSDRCEAEGLALSQMVTDTPVEDAFVSLLARLEAHP